MEIVGVVERIQSREALLRTDVEALECHVCSLVLSWCGVVLRNVVVMSQDRQ